MNSTLKPFDLISLGFMTFAFFLGAGNIIFPTMAGMLAGEAMWPAMLGFLLTAVGLPLLGLFAVARAGGGVAKMTQLLHPGIGIAISVVIFIIIGPLIAAPRTGLVAYELSLRAYSETPVLSQLSYSLLFFGLAALLALYPGRLMDSIGKILTPLLIVLLLVLAVTVMLASGRETLPTAEQYLVAPLAQGIVDGYNTMDALASIMFGMLIIDLLVKKGITEPSQQYRCLVWAALIAAAGLAVVYVSLFFLGAGFGLPGAASGGEILTHFVASQYGDLGMIVLGGVITLACLTTAVGLLSACSDYFSQLVPISYRQFVVINALCCLAVANLDLSVLISYSIPVLVAVYPMAISLMLYSLSRQWLGLPREALLSILVVSVFFGAVEGLKVLGFSLAWLAWMPGFSVGLAWALPCLLVLLAFFVLGRVQERQASASA